jgi:hypothetical protein
MDMHAPMAMNIYAREPCRKVKRQNMQEINSSWGCDVCNPPITSKIKTRISNRKWSHRLRENIKLLGQVLYIYIYVIEKVLLPLMTDEDEAEAEAEAGVDQIEALCVSTIVYLELLLVTYAEE